MTDDGLLWHRIQFTFTITYHYLFPQLTMGLALLIVVFKVSLVVPFLGGSKNAIGLLIIGFALWEAWKFNARRPLPITGPYYVGPPGRAPGISTGGAFSDPEVIL